MWTCASTFVPWSSSRSPISANDCLHRRGIPAPQPPALRPAAPGRSAPPFWCRTNTAKMSPNSMPPAIRQCRQKSATGAHSWARNVAAMCVGDMLAGRVSRDFKPCRTSRLPYRLSVGAPWLPIPAKGRHHMLGKHVLRLDALPMLEPAEVGDDGQFADAALRLECPHLLDDFLRRPDKPISWSTISS